MPSLAWQRFTEQQFIQNIDKRLLSRLLAQHQEFCAKCGLDISMLANDHESDRKILDLFRNQDQEMPAQLLADLYLLDSLADENGHERIQDEARGQGINLEHLGSSLSPEDFALTILLENRELIQLCSDNDSLKKAKRFYEFQSDTLAKIQFVEIQKRMEALSQHLRPFFVARNRGDACDITVHEEKGEIHFAVTHGRLVRTDGSLPDGGGRERVAYRPPKHDKIIYNTRSGILKINAQFMSEREAYIEGFGLIVFGDEGHFSEGELYSLDPLRSSDGKLRLPPGIESARLVEVFIQTEDEQGSGHMSIGHDLIAGIAGKGEPHLHEGSIERGRFLVKYSTGGRARNLEVRPPNIADYDRVRHEPTTEQFLWLNRIRKVKPSSS